MNLLANLLVWAFSRFVVIACHSHRYDALLFLASEKIILRICNPAYS